MVPAAAGGGYKMVVEPRLFLRQLVDFKEGSAPVKKREEQEADHPKLILHFPAQDLLCIVCTL